MKVSYVAPTFEEIALQSENVLYDSNEGGWAPVNDEDGEE